LVIHVFQLQDGLRWAHPLRLRPYSSSCCCCINSWQQVGTAAVLHQWLLGPQMPGLLLHSTLWLPQLLLLLIEPEAACIELAGQLHAAWAQLLLQD
jgi:hypothetical protein